MQERVVLGSVNGPPGLRIAAAHRTPIVFMLGERIQPSRQAVSMYNRHLARLSRVRRTCLDILPNRLMHSQSTNIHRIALSAASLGLTTLLLAFGAGAHQLPAQGPQPAWQPETVPAVWRNLPDRYSAGEGTAWFRCLVEIPESWSGRRLELVVEGVDDAREVFFNGNLVGTLGTFPPEYRSGLGATLRQTLDNAQVLFGQANVVAIRVHQYNGRMGFNVAAPVLFAEQEAIRLKGIWEGTPGDDVAWARLSARAEIAVQASFREIDNADEIARTLKNLDNDAGALSVAEALQRMTVPDDLTVELAVGEPAVRQPLSFKWDARGRLWVVQYLQYPDPAGLKMVSRDKFLRTVYDKTPAPPPHHFTGSDKITIHEDTDGDGVYDKHLTFVEGLSMVTSFAHSDRGLWVLNPPYLLFYPDADRNDVPDGDPEVHLAGFGLEDTHSLANSLRWGPDGWLYACQGSTVSGQIKQYGSQAEPVRSMGQLVWRYHPPTRRYEIFAEGGGNAFGLEIDAQGRIYSGHNGGDTRGFHYVQGGYFQKGFGKHGSLSNPFAFGYFAAMAHHNVPRFTHTFVIHEGNGLPAPYRGRLFGVAPLLSHVVSSQIEPDRSSFKTHDLGYPLTSSDPWFRPVDIQVGPDGALYIADFYEQRIDHASHYQGRTHRESGRIYRLRGRNSQRPPGFDLERLPTSELVQLLQHDNRWQRQTAQRLIAERRDTTAIPMLEQALWSHTGQFALESLWALYRLGGWNEALATRALDHADPYVRVWTVRLLGDDQQVAPAIADKLAALAVAEPHVEVRSQLASSARRLPAPQAIPIMRGLLEHSEDVGDIHLPLLLWWAIENKLSSDREACLALFAEEKVWTLPLVEKHLLGRVMKRFALAGQRKDLLVCARLLDMAPRAEQARLMLAGFEEAYQGRSLAGLPDELLAAMAKVGGGSLALRVRQGQAAAVQEALQRITDDKLPVAERMQYVRIFGDVTQPASVPLLLQVACQAPDHALRNAALTSLQTYEDDTIAAHVLAAWAEFPADVRPVAETLLASRRTWAHRLLTAVDSGTPQAGDLSLDTVRQILLHQDEQLTALVKKHWGDVQGATTDEMLAEIDRATRVINSGSGVSHSGKQLFLNSCGKCHKLFDEGGEVGPDLTAFKRDDLRQMLVTVVNPNLEIREGFENYVVVTQDGQTLSGFIADQDNQVVVLKGADAQTRIIPRVEIDQMSAIKRSLMPEGILKPFDDQQLRDLFAYLRATQPVP